jgi:ribosome-associated translation inhibitor RaiA
MKTHVKFTGMERDDTLRTYAEEKVAAFHKFLRDPIFEAAVCDIEFRKDAHHQSGDTCFAEITLEADGKIHRATKNETTHEKAIDKLKDDILDSLRAEKGRTEAHFLKGAREVKEAHLHSDLM